MSKGRKQLAHVQRVVGIAEDYQRAEASTQLPQTVVEAELLRGDPDKGKRFRKAGGAGSLTRKPHLDALLGSAYVTAWEELARLRDFALERQLTNDEIRRYTQLVDSLAKLARTEKESAPAEDLESMDREELMSLAKEAMKALEEGK